MAKEKKNQMVIDEDDPIPPVELVGEWDKNGQYYAKPIRRPSNGKLYIEINEYMYKENMPAEINEDTIFKVEMFCDGNEVPILITLPRTEEEYMEGAIQTQEQSGR